MAKRKKVNMRPTKSGGQIYMSDDYAKEFRETYAGDTELQKLIEKNMDERMLAGEMTPKESGSMKARNFIDQVEESVRQKYKKPRGMNKGGAAFPDLTGDGKVTKKDILRGRGVKGFKNGGKVRGYGEGGGVCRGGGAAISGTKFSGVK